MFALLRSIFSYKFFPVCWTIFTITLLCVPGSVVPGTGIFGIKHLDKLVHIFLFGMNVLFWGWHYVGTNLPAKQLRMAFLVATTLTIVLGVLMEFVQLYFIPNRSFDSQDIIADSVGAIIAGLWLLRN